MNKPVLVGESNPYGRDPYYALYPAPDGCSGHRLCVRILGMRRAEYLAAFDRVNLCDGPWSIADAAGKADALRGGRLILLGAKVCRAFRVPFRPFEESEAGLVLPHPSGLCRLWNVPGNIEAARRVMGIYCPTIAFGVSGHE